ncbi:hypothetical protein S83_040288 [Arachis hypogaea]
MHSIINFIQLHYSSSYPSFLIHWSIYYLHFFHHGYIIQEPRSFIPSVFFKILYILPPSNQSSYIAELSIMLHVSDSKIPSNVLIHIFATFYDSTPNFYDDNHKKFCNLFVFRTENESNMNINWPML